MSLDGLTLNRLLYELKNTLVGGKIDKIYQPEKDEIIIAIRNKGNNYKLLISSNANYPRIYLTNEDKENPAIPPMFCMLLRKYLQGGKIIDISQKGFDRISQFDIESHDEFKNKVIKTLVVEIMGRHSNIILIDKNAKRIVDSIKRVYPSMNKIRVILPGSIYEYPPSQNKMEINKINKDNFFKMISMFDGKKTERALLELVEGFSPLLSREIAFRSSTNDKYIGELNNNELQHIFLDILELKIELENNHYKPCIAYNGTEAVEFSFLELHQYNQLKFFDSINKAALEFFKVKANKENIKTRSHDLRKIVNIHLDRLYNKLDKQNDELNDAKNSQIYRVYGELLTANLYKLNKKIKEFRTINFYDGNEIVIPLNIKYSPAENAQIYFKKYNKGKIAVNILTKQIEATKTDIEYLEGQLVNLEQCTLPSEIDEIKEELIKEKYIKKRSNKPKQKRASSKPLHFVSMDGFDIYVGKNNVQNDYLTLKFASSEDVWLHTKNIPGSHVIIKSEGRVIPEATLIEAANLAALHSKAKNSSNIPVDYTFKKYVKKPSGAKPGFVIYTNQKTLYVTPKRQVDI